MISYKQFILEKLKIKKTLEDMFKELNQTPIMNIQTYFKRVTPAIHIEWKEIKEKELFFEKFLGRFKEQFTLNETNKINCVDCFIIKKEI